ncbi:MAG: hypothetical protein JW861_00095 [Bacteroidales bacterium]|nr:hypothetical protein [Bacteroidales bacterium]
MKRIQTMLIMILISQAMMAQNNNVVSAYNYHRNGKLDKAKEYIDMAAVHEKTATDPKMWFYRGNIYMDIYRSNDETIKALDDQALEKAYESYANCRKFDSKNTYTTDVIPRLLLCGEEYFNRGANHFNKGLEYTNMNSETMARDEFEKAMEWFQNTYQVYESVGNTDTLSVYYLALSAEQAGKYNIAKENLDKLINEFKYKNVSVYHALYNIQLSQDKDTVAALNTAIDGRKLFPDNLSLIIDETNIYLTTGDTDKALENLRLAQEMDTTNATIYFAVGSIIDKELVGDTTKSEAIREDAFQKATAAYEKAIAVDPDYFDPIYNLGAIYVNKASAILDMANRLPLDAEEEYNAAKAEADEFLTLALPYLERAHEINQEDMSTMVALKEIYTRLNMLEKLGEINAKLNK